MTVMPLKLDVARRTLLDGGVIAYPTEAVWGLGCDPHNDTAVNKLLEIKQRDASKGLILVAASIEQFTPYLEGLDPLLLARLEQSWPGPVTWLVPDNGTASQRVRGDNSSVALRVSAHKPVVDLCRSFGGPIVSTSANRSSRPTARWPWQLQTQLPAVDYCLNGPLGNAYRPSEIRDLVSGQLHRSG